MSDTDKGEILSFLCIKQVLYEFDVYIKTHRPYQTIAPLHKLKGLGHGSKNPGRTQVYAQACEG